MAISPIDLQTLYTQMDKVGKTQLSHQASLQQARETAEQEAKKAAEAKAKSVQKAETGESSAGKITDRGGSSGDTEADFEKKNGGNSGEEPQEDSATAGPDAPQTLHTAGVGNRIDISV